MAFLEVHKFASQYNYSIIRMIVVFIDYDVHLCNNINVSVKKTNKERTFF